MPSRTSEGREGEVAVGAVGQGAHRHHRHDLGEGEPQQHLVLGLHVGWYFMLSHSFPPIRLCAATIATAVGGLGQVGRHRRVNHANAFTTSSTTP